MFDQELDSLEIETVQKETIQPRVGPGLVPVGGGVIWTRTKFVFDKFDKQGFRPFLTAFLRIPHFPPKEFMRFVWPQKRPISTTFSTKRFLRRHKLSFLICWFKSFPLIFQLCDPFHFSLPSFYLLLSFLCFFLGSICI